MATDIASVWVAWELYAKDAADQTARGVLRDMLHELCGLSVDQMEVALMVADYLGTERERKLVLGCDWLRGDIRRHANGKKRCPILVVAGSGEPRLTGEKGYAIWKRTGERVLDFNLMGNTSLPDTQWVKSTLAVEVGHQWVWEYFSTVSATSSS